MERALGLPATSLPCRGSSQNKFAANCIIAVSNFNFPHGILPNGTAKTVFRVQCHRNRRNCSDGSQFFPQKTSGLYGFHHFHTGTKRKQVTRRIAVCQLAGAADPTLPSSTDISLGPIFRGICFYSVTCMLATPLFLVMLVVHPLVLLLDKSRRQFHHLMGKIWASLTLLPFCKVAIEGIENLPASDMPAVYVANHQSYLDIYVLMLLGRSFKFISKTSIFFIPIVGWSMFLTGHIPLRRMDNKSQMECLRRCLNVLKQGASVLFFPEGTRTKDGKMAAFKKGAFSVAVKARVPVVPIVLIGTGDIMPNGMEGILRPGSVKVIVQPPIEGADAYELCEKARTAISEQLIMHGYGVH